MAGVGSLLKSQVPFRGARLALSISQNGLGFEQETRLQSTPTCFSCDSRKEAPLTVHHEREGPLKNVWVALVQETMVAGCNVRTRSRRWAGKSGKERPQQETGFLS